MPGDPFRKVTTGEQITSLPAVAWNAFIDAALAERKRNRQVAPGGAQAFLQGDIIRVKNNSGSDCDRFNILGLDVPVILPTGHSGDDLPEFQSQILQSGITPTTASHLGKFVVLLDPIADGEVGRAYASGCTPCLINVQHADHVMADVYDSQPAKLQSSHAGAAQILWKASSGTGDKWAVVRLGRFGPTYFQGKPGSTIAKGSSGTVRVWIGPPGSEVDSGVDQSGVYAARGRT